MPDRIQLRRTKGWRKPEGAVVVSRGPGRPWGNPFTLADAGDLPDPQQAVVDWYRDWIAAPEQAGLRDRLHELRGRDLCCWCAPDQPCHADVLLDLANEGERK